MESPLSFFRMHWDHEPCNWSAELLFGTMAARRMQNAVPNWSSALRFMESLLSFFECIGTMNPKMRNVFICKQSIVRFMES